MKKPFVIVAILIFIIISSIFLFFLIGDEKKFFAENDLEYYPVTDICDQICKDRLEGDLGFTCTEIENNAYSCREKIIPNDESFIYTYVIPPELGEYYLIKPDKNIVLSSIVQVSLYQNDSVQVSLKNESGLHEIIIEKNTRFVSMCGNGNLKVWTFTDVRTIQGEIYIEMHKRLAIIPEGFDCGNPITIL